VTAIALEPRFTLEDVWRILGDPTSDDRYLDTQLGEAVAAYLSWKENEDGAATETIRSYRYDLARFAVANPDVAAADLTPDHFRRVIALYPAGSRYKVTAVYKDFGKWLYEEERTDTNPVGRLRYPKRQKPPITDLFTAEEKAAIVAAQENIRDRTCVLLLLRAGLRKGELVQLRVRDIDLVERLVLVRRGKGGKARRVPIRGSVVRALDEFMLTEIPGIGREPESDDHILYRATSKNRYGKADPKKPMAPSTAHRWWYRCLERAGIVDLDVTAGRRMHSTRHTYATDLGRATGWNLVAVQKNLGHSSIKLTADTYSQFAYEDQELAVDLLPEIEV
jgi:integrase